MAKHAARTTEDRAAAQQQRRERQTSETEEQREVRLQRMRITHSERIAIETEEQREARLQRMRTKVIDWLPRLKNRERPGCKDVCQSKWYKSFDLHLQLKTVSIYSI